MARDVFRGYTVWERALLWLCLLIALFCLGWRWQKGTIREPPFFRDAPPTSR